MVETALCDSVKACYSFSDLASIAIGLTLAQQKVLKQTVNNMPKKVDEDDKKLGKGGRKPTPAVAPGKLMFTILFCIKSVGSCTNRDCVCNARFNTILCAEQSPDPTPHLLYDVRKSNLQKFEHT